MNVVVIGTGYVGLVSGVCFAELGMRVVCVDKIAERVEALTRGEIPIYEKGLEALLTKNMAEGRVRFTTDQAAALRDAEVVCIAVGTPTRREDGCADLSDVFAAAEEVAASLDHYAVIVTKSTVPAGTGHELLRLIRRAAPELACDVVSNPEFLREGSAVEDFLHPDRVVIGVESLRAKHVLERLYAPLSERGVPVFYTDVRSSELIKYAANTFLAAKVSFINEIADLCEKIGANVEDVARGMGMDSRIGSKFLKPGPGYGGSCFPKDTLAMVGIGEQALSPVTIVEAVIAVNRQRQFRMISKIINAAGGEVEGKKIAFLGLAFKAETDDVRDSVPLSIAWSLARRGAQVTAYDPKAMPNAQRITGPMVLYAASREQALRDADLVVVATEWEEFLTMDLAAAKALLHRPVMVDLRNLFAPEDMAALGFTYYSIGRPAVLEEAQLPASFRMKA
jgi:UDPglucose 6-dehydrogenase